jgi:murein DD-endopeptidase MepM/ murein hydrolase activator NlpD
MSAFQPLRLIRSNRSKQTWWLLAILLAALLASLVYIFFLANRSSGRWAYYTALRLSPETFAQYTIEPGMVCGEAPFAFPTTGAVFGLWDQSYRFGHHHQGIDIFPNTTPGETAVYAAYPGFLTRLPDWKSTIIVRVPEDPLHPNRQIWVYYTHMADRDGNSFIVEDFPPGSVEVYVEAGTLLGYQGNYSGNNANPTGLHLHVSIVRDDGNGRFMNELDIENTYDPSPYFGLPLNNRQNPDEFPLCEGEISYADWAPE